jgi:hypothetical protein
MKRSVKGFEDMAHQGLFGVLQVTRNVSYYWHVSEIMDILRVKRAQVPAQPAAKTRNKRKITSAEAVVDLENEETQPEAGPSTGPGIVQAEAPRSGQGC